MEDKDYFSRLCLYRSILEMIPVSGEKHVLLVLIQRGHLFMGNFRTWFYVEKGKSENSLFSENTLLFLLFLNAFSSKTNKQKNQYAKVIYLEVTCLELLQVHTVISK